MNYSYSLRHRNNPAQSYAEVIVKLLIIAGLICFSLSLYYVALFTSGDDLHGVWILLIGWIGLVVFQLSWFANPLNLLALLLLSTKPKISLFLSVIAFLVASQSFWFSEIPTGFNQEKIFIKELGMGFYLWYLANGIIVFAIFIEVLRRSDKK